MKQISPHTGCATPRTKHTLAQQRLLEILAQFVCAPTRTAAALVRGRETTGTDERSIRRTLSVLHRNGVIQRFPYVAEGRTRGGVGYVYGLSDKGVIHAFKHGYATPATKSFDEHSLRTLDHELEIASFHIAIDHLCASQHVRYAWRQTDLKHTIHPDALFYIADPAHPGKAFCYFLEIERSKFGNYRNGEPQILRKLGAYYRYFNSTDCEREWGFRQFRVLVVQRTEARREGLLRALQEKYRHRMFWLATEPAYRNGIGGDIFKTPKDYAERSYRFLSDLARGE